MGQKTMYTMYFHIYHIIPAVGTIISSSGGFSIGLAETMLPRRVIYLAKDMCSIADMSRSFHSDKKRIVLFYNLPYSDHNA